MTNRMCTFVAVLSVLNLNHYPSWAQSSCPDLIPAYYPSSDSAQATGYPTGDPYATSFTITLDGGTGAYQNYKVTEYAASSGTDGCYTSNSNPALIPPNPGPSGGKWYVQGITWGADNVGWLPASEAYIAANNGPSSLNPPRVNIPCVAQINQALDLLCPGASTPYLYNPSNPLVTYTYQSFFQNCRGEVGVNQVCGNQVPYGIY